MAEDREFQLGSSKRVDRASESDPRRATRPNPVEFAEAPKLEEPHPEAVQPVDGDASGADLDNLGSTLAAAMLDKGYQPVILFGTNNSGKTSLLLSLFSTILSQGKLETGLFLADPVLSGSSGVGSRVHADARHTFEIKTQNFIEGKKIGKTNIDLPFFIPVDFRPKGKTPITFAFLESNGEWYRPTRTGDSLFPKLKREIETFISGYQGGIIFIYLIPYTQSEVYSEKDGNVDAQQILDASLAMSGVLRAYDKIRANYRAEDRHLMLVSKWDAHSITSLDRAASLEPDRHEVEEFCDRRYNQALATFRGLQLREEQLMLNAYCAGIINDQGLLQLRHDDDSRAAVLDYPIKLWGWLYKCALRNRDLAPVSPFAEPPKPPSFIRFVTSFLDKLTS